MIMNVEQLVEWKFAGEKHCRDGKPVTKYGTSAGSGIYVLFTAVMYTVCYQ
jgi:hypothetical protein